MKSIFIFVKSHLFQVLTGMFWLFLIWLYLHYKYSYGYSDDRILKNIYFFLKWEGMYGGLIYIGIYAIRTVIFFPSSLIILLSASLFGLPMAFIYTLIGENLSSVIGYYLGKFFGKNILSENSIGKFAKLQNSIKNDSFLNILTLRLIFVPFDPLSYVSGFFRAEFKGYFWGTFFGTIPGILIFLLAGAGIKNIEQFKMSNIQIDESYMFYSVALVLISLLIVYFLKKRSVEIR